MTINVNTMLKKPGVFTVAPVGALDADSPPGAGREGRSRSQPEPGPGDFRHGVRGLHQQHGDPGVAEDEKKLKQRGAKMVFVNLQPPVKKVFDILNALPSLNVFASVQELDDYLDAMQSAVRGQGAPT